VVLVMRKAILLTLRLLLLLLLVVALAIGLWLAGPVQTGVGEMTRLQEGRVYLQLALDQPGMCRQAYVLGVGSSFVLAPANAVEDAVRSEVRWASMPRRALELLVSYLDGVFHNPPPYECGLPRPQEWTRDLVPR
jgi:hypothetical protein